MKKSFLSFTLAAVLALTSPASALPVLAAATKTEAGTLADDPANVDPEAPTEEEELLPVVGDSVSMNATLTSYVSQAKDDARYDGVTRHYGIDVSKWANNYNNKTGAYETIDWKRVRESGVEFAIIRVGYRSAKIDTTTKKAGIYKDPCFDSNVKGALAAGLKVGFYFFSQAMTVEEAREEAAWMVRTLEPYKGQTTLPLVDDYEYAETTGRRFTKTSISNTQRTKNAEAFLAAIEEAGYEPMLYANRNFLMGDMDVNFIERNYRVWLARWIDTRKGITSADYKGNYSFWQIGDVAVDGIPASTADFDVWYDKDGFVDVSDRSYYADAVKWAVDQKVTSGLSSIAFGSNDSCTRAQIVSFLYRAAGEPGIESDTVSFTDVADNAWYAKAVNWAANAGVTSGVEKNLFAPNAGCTRAQAVALLWRAEGQPEAGDNPIEFSDVKDSWYTTALAWATTHGIVSGTSSTTFSPNDTCTRAQIVTMIYKIYKDKSMGSGNALSS